MTFESIYTLLKLSGIPQKRAKSNKKLSLPFLVACEGACSFEGTDSNVLCRVHNPRIELYTNANDYKTANTLEELLILNNLPFSVSDEIQVSDEGIFVRYYDLETQYDKL